MEFSTSYLGRQSLRRRFWIAISRRMNMWIVLDALVVNKMFVAGFKADNSRAGATCPLLAQSSSESCHVVELQN